MVSAPSRDTGNSSTMNTECQGYASPSVCCRRRHRPLRRCRQLRERRGDRVTCAPVRQAGQVRSQQLLQQQRQRCPIVRRLGPQLRLPPPRAQPARLLCLH